MGEKESSLRWCSFRENETTHTFTNTPGLYRVQQATALWERGYKDQRKGRKGLAQNSEQGPASYPICANTPSYLLLKYGSTPPQDHGTPMLFSSEGEE